MLHRLMISQSHRLSVFTRSYYFFSFAALAIGTVSLSAGENPDMLIFNSKRVGQVKDFMGMGDKAPYVKEIKEIRKSADAIIEKSASEGGAVVTIGSNPDMLEGRFPDRREFFTLAHSWWPDPDSEEGTPYVYKEGTLNPEALEVSDQLLLENMITETRMMALAYFYSDEEKYAEHAAKLLRAWFIDRRTRMNPSLRHAWAIPGVQEGGFEGIFQSRNLIYIPDIEALIAGSESWTEADGKGLREWFNSFIDWMLYSPLAREAQAQKGYHGTSFDMELIASCWLTDRTYLLRMVYLESVRQRFAEQLAFDGQMPIENEGIDAWSGYVYNFESHMLIAKMVEKMFRDTFEFSPKGKGDLPTTADYLAVYFPGTINIWPHSSLGKRSSEHLVPILHMATSLFTSETVLEALNKSGSPIPGLEQFLLIPERRKE